MKKLVLCLLATLVWSLASFAQLPIKENGTLLNLNNAQIYYETYGQGEPLFLLHGFFGTVEHWRQFIDDYSKHYRVIVWDMRGHGRSNNPDHDQDFKHEQAAQDLLALMDHLTIDKAKAIGHSSGGMTLLYAASMAPEKFEAIIPVAAQHHYTEPVRDWIKSKVWESFFTPEELDSLHGSTNRTVLKRQFYDFWQLEGDPALTKERLQNIKARSLIVHGDNDFVPVSQAWELFENIPNARLWISPNTAHRPHLGADNEADFIKRTLDFLEGEGW